MAKVPKAVKAKAVKAAPIAAPVVKAPSAPIADAVNETAAVKEAPPLNVYEQRWADKLKALGIAPK